MNPQPNRPIALIGLMGAGKSAVASGLGERLGASAADLDAMIEAVEGCTIAELFERSGEVSFRRREGELLARVVASGVRVIACGGGIVLDPAQRLLLRESCFVVWLEVSPAEAARRIERGPGAPAATRPLLAGGIAADRLAALLAAREPHYAECAHLRVPTDGLSTAEVVDRVLAGIPGGA
jgi:shikimate kinase